MSGFDSWDYLMKIIEGSPHRFKITVKDIESGEHIGIEADLKDVLEDYEAMMNALEQIRKAANSAIV